MRGTHRTVPPPIDHADRNATRATLARAMRRAQRTFDTALTLLERSRTVQLCAIALLSIGVAAAVERRIDSAPPPPATAGGQFSAR